MTRALVGQIPILGLGQVPRLHSRPLVIDYFAGGGGVSEGFRLATGRGPDVAINHCQHAVNMHALNHPGTRHLHTDVWDVDPVRDLPAGDVGAAWFSPDCRHHSSAKGGKPLDNKARGLAWVALRVAARRRPAVMFLENVKEFRTWGPLNRRHHPIKKKRGQTFARFLAQIEWLGYVVDYRILDAADFGAPTHRRRLIVIARCDGLPIAWPTPTHGPGREHPYRTAAECIDWSLPALSIFATRDEARAFAKEHGGGTPNRPLAPATMRRIAEGVRRFVIETTRPFIVQVNHGLVTPLFVQTGHGERTGQAPRVRDVGRPYPTITAEGGSKQALICAWIAKHNLRTVGQPVDDEPAPTATGCNHTAIVAAFLTKYYGSSRQAATTPLHTATVLPRFGVVSIMLDGEPWELVDITLRMLTPRELARCQGFGDEYVLTGTQAEQVARIGNSVPPALAAAVVRANMPAIQEGA